MNRKVIMITILLLFPLAAFARVGCQDNSYHLKKKYDNKEYHFVDCACSCTYQTIPPHNRCSECGHVFIPQEWEIIDDATAQLAMHDDREHTDSEWLITNPQTIMQALIAQFKINAQ
jgi:hypothetical protein